MRVHGTRTARLGVGLSWEGGDSTGGAVRLPTPTDRFDELLDAARDALRRAYVRGGAATHMHVVAADLRRGLGFQMSLFDRPDPKREAVARAKAAVNEKLGRFAVRSGATLYLPAVYRDPANAFDICDVRGKVCF